MEQENDLLLSKLAVRVRDKQTSTIVGSGTIYYSEDLKNKVYIITAAHCLYDDGDSFSLRKEFIEVDFYSSSSDSYTTITHKINHELVCPEKDKDVAVLLMDKEAVEAITGVLPSAVAVKERHSVSTFAGKGFPSATHGEELGCIYPTWAQAMTGAKKFQLHLNEDYKGWATNGFSGSGIFLHANSHLYLYGIFTRYREESMGKVIIVNILILLTNYWKLTFYSLFPILF